MSRIIRVCILGRGVIRYLWPDCNFIRTACSHCRPISCFRFLFYGSYVICRRCSYCSDSDSYFLSDLIGCCTHLCLISDRKLESERKNGTGSVNRPLYPCKRDDKGYCYSISIYLLFECDHLWLLWGKTGWFITSESETDANQNNKVYNPWPGYSFTGQLRPFEVVRNQ